MHKTISRRRVGTQFRIFPIFDVDLGSILYSSRRRRLYCYTAFGVCLRAALRRVYHGSKRADGELQYAPLPGPSAHVHAPEVSRPAPLISHDRHKYPTTNT